MPDPMLFAGSTYQTSDAIKPSIAYRCPFIRSFLFHTGYFLGEFLNARRLSVRGEYDNLAWRQSSEVYARHIERTGATIRVEGLDNLDRLDGGAVIVGNHMSMLETFLLPAMLLPRGDVTFVVKKSLITHPVFGPIMRAVDPIAVGRENPREDLKAVLSEGVRHLHQRRNVCIFPQTTRVVGFDAAKFNSIGVKLAAKAGVPVVPLAIKTDFMLNGRLIKELGAIHPERDIHFEFGEPVEVNRGSTREAQQVVVGFIEDRLRRWGLPVVGA